MASHQPAPAAEPAPDADEPELGGEAVCWLSRVCPECGRLAEGQPRPATCPTCGGELLG